MIDPASLGELLSFCLASFRLFWEALPTAPGDQQHGPICFVNLGWGGWKKPAGQMALTVGVMCGWKELCQFKCHSATPWCWCLMIVYPWVLGAHYIFNIPTSGGKETRQFQVWIRSKITLFVQQTTWKKESKFSHFPGFLQSRIKWLTFHSALDHKHLTSDMPWHFVRWQNDDLGCYVIWDRNFLQRCATKKERSNKNFLL